MFSVSEAVSIWDEIVETRKKEMSQVSVDEPLKLAHVLASQVVIERHHLAEWDNSARAWLRRADEAKNKEQTQLMLILNNLSMAVNAKISTYASVISAWTTALVMMEELLSGKPQGIQDGSLLLALSCWHLYPDLIVSSAVIHSACEFDILRLFLRSWVTKPWCKTIPCSRRMAFSHWALSDLQTLKRIQVVFTG